MKKFWALLLAMMLVFTMVAGCGGGAEEPAPPPANGDEEPAPEPEQPIRVGLLLPGEISDMGWNASGYEALLAVQEQYGAEISYTESVTQSDMEEVFRSYAIEGYDVIFGHGFEFGDFAERVAADFPDTKFVVASSELHNPDLPNLASGRILNEYQGFVAGALAALLTETGTVGFIGGHEIPPIRRSIQGAIVGARYVNPDINIQATLTGSGTDVAAAKETALAMVDAGADVLFANANQAGLGPIEAAAETGVWSIGSNQDQNPFAPDHVVQSVLQINEKLYTYIVGEVIAGTFEGRFYGIGIDEGGVTLAPSWHGFDEQFPEVKEAIEEIMAGLADGSITFEYADITF